MIDIILSGANGKMGQVISDIVNKNASFKIIAGVDKNNKQHFSYSVFKTFKETNINSGIIIDFSHPDFLNELLEFAIENKIAAVLCTTGYSLEQIQQIKLASTKIPIFFSGNMSLGINLLIELAKKATKVLSPEFDIEIIEKHHNLKIDAPSGTALMIAQGIEEAKNEKLQYVYERASRREKRKEQELGIHSIRGGTIPGEHEVIFAGYNEIVSIKHSAQNKEIFANGAINAAKFLKGKSPGLYNMNALLNSK